MKQTLALIMFIICLSGFSQSERELVNNFTKGENNIIYWQRITETELSHAEMLDAVIESGFFKDIEVTGSKVICVLRPYKVNYEQFGYTVLEASSFIAQNLITGTVIFELGNRRYRTTVKNIQLIQNSEEGTGIVTPLEYHVLNRYQEMKFPYFKNGSDILNKDFAIKTTLKLDNEEW
ncbi:MAG TPA: hypothetical protein VK212_11105 [Lentimicrobium sp.]|nr:hypothetical protein [Lentimicrobium sp.]